ncbi:VanZ family protein [Pseudocnuella soli]|uniref:VanZ family protein n=1 Tax=Pseudocnuella soli TaxID=2502779 RepID=UPI0010516436|nr:VanZ family protein [Pseudocnuella soli]
MQPSSQQKSSKTNIANKLTVALLVIYLAILCWILLLKLGVRFSYMHEWSFNLIPFSKADIGEMVLNVLAFVPLGIYTAMLFVRWHWGKILLFCCGFSVLVESIQFVLAIGAFDITDIITNTTGGLIGLALFYAMKKAFGNRGKAQQFINVLATIVTAMLVLFLFLLKMNLLPIRYQ